MTTEEAVRLVLDARDAARARLEELGIDEDLMQRTALSIRALARDHAVALAGPYYRRNGAPR